MTDREYREIHRELDERYRSQIESLRAQVQMLMDPIVQLKMLQPNPPMTFQLSDTETWNLAIEKAAQNCMSLIAEQGMSDNPAYVRYNPADAMAKRCAAVVRALKRQ